MSGKDAISYLQSVPWQGTRLGLSRVKILLEKFGNPERTLRFIHIAGTNGKGSTAAMTAAILHAAGYRTGLYTSPFLQFFNERMQIDGTPIPDDELGELTESVRHAAEEMSDPPTEFELITVIAMLYFKHHHCDIVVLEVGLGGRLDATNVIAAPEVAVICNIGLDHTAELGDTLAAIAGEKAGIIKPGCETVLYQPASDEVDAVVRAACQAQHATLHVADFTELSRYADTIDGQWFNYRSGPKYHICLLGTHQMKNAAVVLEIVAVLNSRGWNISSQAVVRGFENARWPGRFELLSRDPIFLVDGGHNRQCVESVRDALGDYFPGRKVIFIMGVLRDKDYASMAPLLTPLACRFFTVTPASPRALSAEELADFLRPAGLPVEACASATEAAKKALRCAGKDDIICSVGSLYMTGEIRAAVLSEQR